MVRLCVAAVLRGGKASDPQRVLRRKLEENARSYREFYSSSEHAGPGRKCSASLWQRGDDIALASDGNDYLRRNGTMISESW